MGSCKKTVYDLEGVTIGGPGNEQIYHSKCFKCAEPGCGWKLSYSNYCYSDGQAWCKNHNPMTGTSNTLARTLSQKTTRKFAQQRRGSPTPANVRPAGSSKFCPKCGSKAESDGVFCAN